MKKLFICLLSMGLPTALLAQKISSNKVPATVKQSLTNAHPSATATTWEWEDANYEANFKESGKGISCVLNKQGTILETETELVLAELPASSQAYMEKHYKGKKPKEIAKIVKTNGDVNYEVVLKKGQEILFDASGNFKEVEKEKKD